MNIGDFFKGKDGENPGQSVATRPCAMPAMQQFLGATRGATEAFCGVGRHVQSSLRSLAAKKAGGGGSGLGFDVGRGFRIGLAVKREAFHHKFQSCFRQAMLKMMIKLGVLPPIPGSLQSGLSMISGTSDVNVQALVGSIAQLASQTTKSASQGPTSSTDSEQEATASLVGSIAQLVSQTTKSASQGPTSSTDSEQEATASLVGSIAQLVSQTTKRSSQEPISSTDSKQEAAVSKGTPDMSLVSSYEKAIGSFLQKPISNDEAEKKISELAGQPQSENNVLQVLLKHQQILEELMEKNEKLEKVLVEDLNVPAAKLQASSKERTKTISLCSDCFECRRRQRKPTK